jgi:hypothetical protein
MAKSGGERLTNYEPAEPRVGGSANVVFAKELVFIDPNVDDLETLLSHLRPGVGHGSWNSHKLRCRINE